MTSIRVKGFKIYKDRHGKVRCYHRATGTAIDLKTCPLGSPEFFAACAGIHTPPKPKAGTLKLLIQDYRLSPSFQTLRKSTKSFYQAAFDYLEPIGDTPIPVFDRPLVIRIRDKAYASRGWYFANQLTTALNTIFSWGSDRGLSPDNPAAKIKRIQRPKDLPRANRPWKDEERFAVLEHCSPHMAVPIALMMYMGMDPIDALTTKKEQFDGRGIEYSRTKTGETVWHPLPAALVAIIQSAIGHSAPTLAANSHGKPWTKSGFNTMWMRLKHDLEKAGKVEPGLTLKGLRHSHATILAEMGEDDRAIADALAQRTEGMARWYSRDANRRKKLENVVEKYDREEASRREKVSNRSEKMSNP